MEQKGGGRMKKTTVMILGKGFIVVALLISIFSAATVNAEANEQRSVETEGSIQFTGRWNDPNPEPSPPAGPSTRPKPGGNLPQTNEKQSIGMPLIGWWLLFIVGYLYSRRYQSQSKHLQASIAKSTNSKGNRGDHT